MSKAIKIDGYISRIENGIQTWYAVKGKQEYIMPYEYAVMYTNDYLAIQEVEVLRPDFFGEEESEPFNVYIPLYTGGSA